VTSLWTQEAEARQHAGEAEKMVSNLLKRAHKDGEEAAQVKNGCDELHQRDAEAR
jgi:pyrroloquinoline quinone (PQQ) biosynthesis protein C